MYHLTDRQREILSWVEDRCRLDPEPPSVREVAGRFQMTANAAHEALKALEEKGALVRMPGIARGLISVRTMALSDSEQTILQQCEAVIGRGVRTFIEVGSALAAIRDGRLYRQGHETFEVYCRDRWGFERTYAYRLIHASKVAENVANCQQTPPKSEAVARELTRIDAKEQAEVLEEARQKAGGEPTAAEVREVVEQRGAGSGERVEGSQSSVVGGPSQRTTDDGPRTTDHEPSFAAALEDFIRKWVRRYDTAPYIVASVLENLAERVKDQAAEAWSGE